MLEPLLEHIRKKYVVIGFSNCQSDPDPKPTISTNYP